jgi:iron-sulfur cluster insertion protein
MISLTQSAQKKIEEIMIEENDPTLKLRVFVQGGGCSGLQYGFTLDNEQTEEDFEIEAGPVKMLVDVMSSQYLQGASIDYTEDVTGAQFKIKNPNAQSTCGCGNSFQPLPDWDI